MQKLASSSIVRHQLGNGLGKFTHVLLSSFRIAIRNVILVLVNPICCVHVLFECQQHVLKNDCGVQQSKDAAEWPLLCRDLHSDGTQPRETSFEDSNRVFRSHPNLRQQLVEPFMFCGNFFATLFLERRHHEWTVREGRVAQIELVLAETILRILMQIHVSTDSVVMGRSRMTRMATTNLSVAIANDHHGQSASVLSSFAVRSALRLRFKHKWKQGSVCDSNHIRKSSFLHHLLRKFLSFLLVWPIAASRTKLENRLHDSVATNIGGSLTNAEHLPLVFTVGSRTFSANALQEDHQLKDDRSLGSSFFLVADCREFFVVFNLSKDPVKGRSGHATFL